MARSPRPRLLARILPAAIGLGLVAIPDTAAAGPQGFDEGPYLHLAPGIVAIELCCDVGYQSAAAGGYMWTFGRMFKLTFGGAFEFFVDDVDVDDLRLRALPELRLGAGNRRVWGYGLLGGSFVMRFGDDFAPGFGPQLGGGAQVAIYKGLYVGGEMDFDIDIFPTDDDVDPTMWFKALIGYNF